jgi:hypothetical protein
MLAEPIISDSVVACASVWSVISAAEDSDKCCDQFCDFINGGNDPGIMQAFIRDGTSNLGPSEEELWTGATRKQ